MNRLVKLTATGLYSGYSPIAPGTAGSLLALLLFMAVPGFKSIILLPIIICTFFIGVRVSGIVEKIEGKDPSIVVIDEIAGMWLSVLLLPAGLHWGWFVGAFFLFRFFDIVKLFPVNISQNLPGGWGIMIDDILAAVYTQIILRLLLLIV